MSIEHLNAAFKSDVKPSARKFVLVALADYANEKGLAYPSIETLANKTGQDRKTVRQHLVALVELGYISDTGERVGKTNQIPKYQISLETLPETGALKSTKNGSVREVKTPKNGGLKDSQKRYTEPPVSFNHQKELKEKEFSQLQQRKEIVEYLNRKAGKNFKPVATNTDLVKARMDEGYTVDEIRAVIDMKVKEWKGTDFNQYLQPSTLFGKTKFSQYYGNLGETKNTGLAGLSESELRNAI